MLPKCLLFSGVNIFKDLFQWILGCVCHIKILRSEHICSGNTV